MSDLRSLMATALGDWAGEPLLERELFGTADAQRIADIVDNFCAEHLGARVAGYEFFASSVGSVHGLRLADERRVVLKAHRTGVSRKHLAAVQQVQTRLADSGFPAPRPLLGPTALGQGVAVVETLLDRGTPIDAHDSAARQLVAAGLARLIALAASPASLRVGLTEWRAGLDRLWREPHDARFDFVATNAGAEWIDQLAAQASRTLDEYSNGPMVIGHGDWRVEHLRFDAGELTAAYDWDSLAVGPEPVFAGAAAHAFTADWTTDRDDQAPAMAESMAFLDDYQVARGMPFDDRQRRAARAALVATMAYSARCQHSDTLTDFGTRPPQAPTMSPHSAGGFVELLARHGERLLTAATP